ncbi:ankyrin repeat domain-containing protein [Endozoicomonas sp. ONNA2]|uniref:ankyrin repeat domain-containing protein n=1 Tax=Endozoicomonas sp. ONNA2 TaxID=2828741 RepID=UPI002147AE5A|nr:ankyrin repeat domain-containing protein [Endozoicomonas sp. ONNA2]
MTPTHASMSSLATNFIGLTTKSEEKDDGPYEGKQVTIPAQDNPGFLVTGFLTKSAILQPPYNADHFEQNHYKMVSLLESRVITAINQDASETQIKEIFCEGFKNSADAQDVLRRMFNRAHAKNDLSLASAVATLPAAKAYLVELSSRKQSPDGLVKFLLQAGVDPNAGATGKQTPLYQAAESGNMAVVDHLLQANADPNAQASGEETPLYRAAITLSKQEKMYKDVRIVAGVSAELGYLKQYCNKMENCVEVVKKLIEAGADPDPLDAQGRTPLTLLTKNATFPQEDYYKWSFQLFKYLLNTGKANPNGNTSGKNTPLYIAALSKSLAFPPTCLEMLLDAHANPDALAKGRDTPLYAAAALGTPGSGAEIVRLLLKAGANADAFSTGKDTPLYGAIAGQEDSEEGYFSGSNAGYNKSPFVENRIAVVEQLLTKADANANAVGKETPLYAVVTGYQSDPGMVSLLLSKGADPNAKAKGEETPLRHVLEFILQNKKDKTSIKMAINQVINPLADYGADPDAGTKQEEKKPRSIAKNIGNKQLSKCLAKMSDEFRKRH